MIRSSIFPSKVKGPTSRTANRHGWPVLLSLLVAFSLLLVACGGNGSSASSSSGPVTLTFGWWSNTPAKDTAMKSWIADFEHSHPNITVKPEIIPWTNYYDKLKTTTAGGNAYDIIGMCSCMAAPYYDGGALYDLSKFPDYQDAVKNLSTGPLKLNTWSGKVYGMPIGTSVSVLGYNKNLLKAAGVAFPDPVKPMTFDEFKTIAKKLTKTENGKIVQYALMPTDILDYDMFVRMEGGSVYDNPVNPTKITINTPEGIQGLKDYQSLFTEKIAPPYDELTNGPWSFDLGSLQTNKIAFARVGAWLFSDIQKSTPNVAITPVFRIKDPVVTGGANSLSIYKGSKHAAEAWQFLKWAAQTPAETSFAKFSDIPADKTAIAQMDTYIQPKEFVPTLTSALGTFQPSVMVTKDQVTTTLNDILTDMMHGKLTPEQTAAKMQQQGNALLSAS